MLFAVAYMDYFSNVLKITFETAESRQEVMQSLWLEHCEEELPEDITYEEFVEEFFNGDQNIAIEPIIKVKTYAVAVSYYCCSDVSMTSFKVNSEEELFAAIVNYHFDDEAPKNLPTTLRELEELFFENGASINILEIKG